jgi:hypothetical protein
MNKIFAAVLVMLIAAPALAAPAGSNRQTYENVLRPGFETSGWAYSGGQL